MIGGSDKKLVSSANRPKNNKKNLKPVPHKSARYTKDLLHFLVLFAALATFVLMIKIFIDEVHIYGAVEIKEPTCSKMGYTEKICSVCGKVLRSDYTDSCDHTYCGEPIVKYNRFLDYEEIYYECAGCGELSDPEIIRRNAE